MTDYKQLCAELLLFSEEAGEICTCEGLWPVKCDPNYTLLNRARAALAEPEPEPVPVAWCRTDEFSNAMKRGGSFNGWKDPGAGADRCDMRLYAFPPQPH